MKKSVLYSVIAVVLLLGGFFGFKFKDSLFAPNFPEPTSIPFEKQLPVYSYNWKFIGVYGKPISFIEYMHRNVIVNYWSPNSEESVEELKIWAKLYEDYKDKNVFFIFATKDSQVDVNKFLAKEGYVFPVFYSTSEPIQSIVLDKTPKTYLITKSGRIVVNHSGPANWNSENFRKTLDEVLKQNK